MSRKKIIIGGIALLGVCGVVALMSGGGDNPPPGAEPAADGAASGPTTIPTDAPPMEPWADVKAFRETATDLQWDAHAKGLEGSKITDWPGTVMEVTASGDQFRVQVDFDNDEYFNTSDVSITTDNPDAAAWSKGAAVVVSGTVQRVNSGLGVVSGLDLYDDATVRAP